mmetsp:Transcript_19627/g.26526  ORF Transcript_19627/g.26526 Transcript_19627/m.26526 type:complete len:177 (-) Transcript_19627:769-1299(-)
MEFALARCDTQGVEQLDNELGVDLVVEQVLKVGIRGEATRRHDQMGCACDGFVDDRRLGLDTLVVLKGVINQHVKGLESAIFDHVELLVELLQAREANDGILVVCRAFVRGERDEGEEHAREVFGANEHVEVVKTATLEDLDHASEHACPGLKHIKLRCEAHGNWVVWRDRHLILS